MKDDLDEVIIAERVEVLPASRGLQCAARWGLENERQAAASAQRCWAHPR